MKKIVIVISICCVFLGCQKEELDATVVNVQQPNNVEKIDISNLSELNSKAEELFNSIIRQTGNGLDIKLVGFSFEEDLGSQKALNSFRGFFPYEHFSRVTLFSNAANDIYDIYSVNEEGDPSAIYVVIVSRATGDAIDFYAKIVFSNNTLVLTNPYSNTLVNWGPCFVKCMRRVIDSNNASGAVISIYGTLGAILPVFGAAAGVFLGMGTLGCAGGCA